MTIRQLRGKILQPVNGILILINLGVAILRRMQLSLLNHAQDLGVPGLISRQVFAHGTKCCLIVRRKLEPVEFR